MVFYYLNNKKLKLNFLKSYKLEQSFYKDVLKNYLGYIFFDKYISINKRDCVKLNQNLY